MTQEQYSAHEQVPQTSTQPTQGPPPGYYPPPGYPPPGYPSYGYQQVALPTIWPTLLITFFFGLFGLIPAITHTNKAKMAGKPTNSYWITFGCTLAGSLAFWMLLLIIAGASATTTTHYYP
jgi:hypothetical protein